MIKTMLVHFAGTAADESVYAQAIALARSCDAHLDCVHVRPSKGQLLNLAATHAVGVGVEPNVGEILESLEAAAQERAGKARASFEKMSSAENIALADAPSAGGLSAAFLEETGNEVEVLVRELQGHDLAIVAGGGVDGGLRAGDRARLLVEAGRPLLLSPVAARKNLLNCVAVAWKPTPESSRALAAAMPLLRKAKKVVVLTASEGAYDADQDGANNILSYLAWHGVSAQTHKVLPAGRSAAEAVLDAVRDARADMLVMGAYGRGRLAEIVFGGFTQRVLDRTELPIFLLH